MSQSWTCRGLHQLIVGPKQMTPEAHLQCGWIKPICLCRLDWGTVRYLSHIVDLGTTVRWCISRQRGSITSSGWQIGHFWTKNPLLKFLFKEVHWYHMLLPCSINGRGSPMYTTYSCILGSPMNICMFHPCSGFTMSTTSSCLIGSPLSLPHKNEFRVFRGSFPP